MIWPTFIIFAILSVPGAIAGPACARKYYQTEDCITRCGSNWGYPGLMMGTDAWGTVSAPVNSADWNDYISEACGLFSSSSGAGSGVAGAIGSSPSSLISSIVVPSASINAFVLSSSSTLSSATASTTTSSPLSTSTATSTSPELVTSTNPVVKQTKSVTSTTTLSTATKEPTTTSLTKVSTSIAVSTTAASGSSSSGGTSASDIAAYLAGHNDARAQHGANPLTWSDNLASLAQKWANNCLFQHSGGSLGPFGENLAAGTGSDYGIAAAIQSWVNEAADYNPTDPVASHFTQVVWKATTQVGCAVQSCSGIFAPSFGEAQFFVCEYNPAGNVKNEFSTNVQV